MSVTIQMRGGTDAAWSVANPVLAVRELGFATDLFQYKIGDGVTAWNSLPYRGADGAPGGTITEADLATGSVPRWDLSIEFAHIGAITSQRVLCSAARDSDEREMDPVIVSGTVTASDVITFALSGVRGPLSGTIRVHYALGV